MTSREDFWNWRDGFMRDTGSAPHGWQIWQAATARAANICRTLPLDLPEHVPAGTAHNYRVAEAGCRSAFAEAIEKNGA